MPKYLVNFDGQRPGQSASSSQSVELDTGLPLDLNNPQTFRDVARELREQECIVDPRVTGILPA